MLEALVGVGGTLATTVEPVGRLREELLDFDDDAREVEGDDLASVLTK